MSKRCYREKIESGDVAGSPTRMSEPRVLPDKRMWVLNTDAGGVGMTLTCAHHYVGNIIFPRQGYREMGVLVKYGDKIKF